jgi:predicted dehydrogenase
MKKYKVGIIGAGAIAQACHIPGYASAKNCELTAVADPEEKCLAMLEERGWNFAAVYHDYKKMLSGEKLDVISICAPNKFHAEMAIACLNAGVDVLLEKPIAVNMKEAEAIRSAVKATGRRLMVGFSHRFNDLNNAAKTALIAGKIGKPYMIRVRFAHTGPWPGWAKTDWFYNPEMSGGGALMDMAVHAFDIAQWFIGPVTAVSGKTATLRKNIKVDDNVVAIMEFGNKCMGYVECGWTSPSGFCGMEIMGDNGIIYSDYIKNQAIMVHGQTSPSGETKMQEVILKNKWDKAPWAKEMEYFTAHLGRPGDFSPDINDGVDTLRVVLAAYESSQTGKRIEIKNKL